MSKVRVHNLHISLDGFSAGDFVTFDKPMGDARSLFAYFDGRVIDGVHHIDDPITADRLIISGWSQGIGAEIMGRKKFGPQTGPWRSEDDWRGWWGDAPPFGTPVVVLTHYPRDPIEFDNGTVFHFFDGTPEQALAFTRDLAGDGDIRLGGGPSSVRDFLHAGLVDFMHLIFVPTVLGTGVSIWDGSADLQKSFDIESITTGTGLTHQFWNRK
ncbi:dihydrofolate reductase family protein [Gordonia sp. (in: high G+C Gram-positive bacteria)]|uniref:dihydrofolate reductase family protein n=1 Tax=Gordonia sp. (in: high G+C Gram-positive bacteria) TaxID=84139 RepID=UPI003C77CD15